MVVREDELIVLLVLLGCKFPEHIRQRRSWQDCKCCVESQMHFFERIERVVGLTNSEFPSQVFGYVLARP